MLAVAPVVRKVGVSGPKTSNMRSLDASNQDIMQNDVTSNQPVTGRYDPKNLVKTVHMGNS